METARKYRLISEESIEQINSKIVVLNRAAQFMKNAGFDDQSGTVAAYIAEISVIVNGAIECNVVPRCESEDVEYETGTM
jgi:hypothetical protein